jgi:hypothetical protein
VSGDLTPADAAEIGKLIDSYVKAFETAELSERLERLEGMTICSSQAPTAGLSTAPHRFADRNCKPHKLDPLA